jgi:hypothetical protein
MPDPFVNSSEPALTAAERPHCPKCGVRMSLAGIMLGPNGFDYRNFECTSCTRVVTLMVEVDRLQTSKGWLRSMLKTPD